MSEYDWEEASYWWAINDICDLIRQYGYTKVLMDIDKSLKSTDLSLTIDSIVQDAEDDVQ